MTDRQCPEKSAYGIRCTLPAGHPPGCEATHNGRRIRWATVRCNPKPAPR